MANTASFHEHVFKNTRFTNNLISLIVDEAHCISEWGTSDFRPEWGQLSKTLARLPSGIPTMAASATFPPKVKSYIGNRLGFAPNVSTSRRCLSDMSGRRPDRLGVGSNIVAGEDIGWLEGPGVENSDIVDPRL